MGLADDLSSAMPDVPVITDPGLLESHRRDHAGLVDAGTPVLAVLPATADEVARIVSIAAQHRVPIVARGAGSGLAGGANAIDGAITLLTTRMDRILDIDIEGLTATVQSGVITADLATAAGEQGLFYPPDPASRAFSTIGGNIATNAGGLCCVKYGVTRESVLGLRVVLADGSVTHVGSRTIKSVAGLDLTGLFVGSEGTLGIITEATVRLRPQPPPPTTLVAQFDDLTSAGTAITAITRATTPALLEILDQITLAAIERHRPMGLDTGAAALVLAQSDLAGEAATRETAAIRAACEEAGAAYVATSTDRDEAEMLLEARRVAYPALEAQGSTLLDDVAVPRGCIADLLREVQEIGRRHDLTIGTFGHAGDGNMHPTVVYDPATQSEVARSAFDDIVQAALALGGTVTGEHGVGLLKREWLRRELDAPARRLQRAIKDAFDPEGLLNPDRGLP